MKKLIAIALVTVMLLSAAGCGRKPAQTTEATEEGTTPTTHETTAPTQTDGTTPETQGVTEQETTAPSQETTSPADTTAPAEPEPTEPTVKPTEPKPTQPKPTDPPVKPTEPEPTEEPTEPKPSDKFGGVTPENISVANTAGWKTGRFDLFRLEYWDSMTHEQQRNYWDAYYGGYDCGTPGHDCRDKYDHASFLQPCFHCGKTLDCQGRICKDEWGFTYCDDSKCYSYDVKKDPSKYCQTCGKPVSTSITTDFTKLCTQYLGDINCNHCGQPVKAHECHTCKQEDIDAFNANKG